MVLFFKIYCICVDVFVSVLVYSICMWVPMGARRRCWILGNCERSYMDAGNQMSPLEEQQLLLMAEPFPQMPNDAVLAVTDFILPRVYQNGLLGHPIMKI